MDESQYHGVSQIEFPKSETIADLTREYDRLHQKPKIIALLGQTEAAKSNIVDAILSTRCADHESVHEFKGNLVRSQFDVDHATITQYTTRDIAPQNLMYFPVLKDALNSAENQEYRLMEVFGRKNRNCLGVDQGAVPGDVDRR